MKESENKKLIAVRVRGRVRLLNEVKDTLNMLRLYKTNYGIILENTPTNMGMLQKTKNYITWGEAEESLVDELFTKRGNEYKGPMADKNKKIKYNNRYIEYKGKKYNKFFKLNPPKGGYGRKGIKTSFAMGGALGYRAQAINALIKKML